MIRSFGTFRIAVRNTTILSFQSKEKSPRETLQRLETFCTELLVEISPYVEMTNCRGFCGHEWNARASKDKLQF